MRLAVLIMMTALMTGGCGSTPEVADLVLTGGKVIPLGEGIEPAHPTAVAVQDGRILAVGADERILEHRGPDTRVVDLAGAVVVPGFNDSHAHLHGLGKALAQIDLVGTASAEAAVLRVKQGMADFSADAWIEGRGWDQNDWAVAEYPHRNLLDAVAPDRPVYLRRIDGHAAWANSKALELAGITAATTDPAGGEILRDEAGEPTGILIDNAMELVGDVIPEASADEIRRRIGKGVEHCLAHGITGMHEAGVTWKTAQVYREMADAGELGMRVYAMYGDDPETLEKAFAEGPVTAGDGMLTLRAVKLYSDGALGSRGALLKADYTDQPGHRGLAVSTPEHMSAVARRCGETGFQPCVHAIGDQANHVVLNIFEELYGELGLEDARWRVEHAQILDPADIPRFARLGVIPAMQPVHCTSDMDWADERLGEDRLAGAYAWKSLLDSGAHVCFGTDFPVERVDPLHGLYSARTRTHHDGTPPGGWQAHETVTGRQALEMYTVGSAHAAFMEEELGRIAPGYRADLTILDGNPVECEPADLLAMQVLMTVVDGRVAWEKP
jgi:predicted amidohydrolase YtcJ